MFVNCIGTLLAAVPANDVVARREADRPPLARDHRLVDLGRSVDDHPVRGHPAPRPHEDDVVGAEIAERLLDDAVAGDPLDHVREQRREGVQGACGPR